MYSVYKGDIFDIWKNLFLWQGPFNQRSGKGGRPAIIANCKKYDVQDLTNNLVQIPWGVEAVWCVLTPKNITHNSKIQKIACCSFYSKPNSRKKSLLLDHISDTFNILSTKYGKGLEFIISNYFQDRQMSVKWHGCSSVPRKIKGGGPQGATTGLLEYLSQY